MMQKLTNNADILLINCPFGHLESPYLGLARIASFLNWAGIKAQVLDMNIGLYHYLRLSKFWDNVYLYPEKQKFLTDYHLFYPFVRKQMEQVFRSPHRLFGFTAHRFNLLFINDIAKRLDRALACKIVIGGPSTQIEGERRFLYHSDNVAIVKGMGERVLPCLIQDYERGRLKPEYIDSDYPEGIIPYETTFDEFDIDAYLMKCLPVLLNSGCVGRCAFCDERYYTPPRKGDVGRVCSEIERYVAKKSVEYIEFNDLAINSFPQVLSDLCHRLTSKGLTLQWNSHAIPNRYLTNENCRLLKRSGCGFLRFGIESGSASVLKKMKKPFTLEEAEIALRNCTNQGIKTHINLIVGFPGESQREFKETLGFIIRNKRHITRVDNIFTCYITPRSELERSAESYGIILPEDNFWYRWYTADGSNTYELRKQRNDLLVKFLGEEGIEFGTPDCEKNKELMAKE